MAPAILNLLSGRSDAASLGPLAARSVLLARDASEQHRDPTTGAIRPQAINNNAVFAIFGILGAAFVVVGIWFFFWAKNGGFYFKKNDWDDYKSTVMRRKVGPNGTIYTDATPSTVLGGGSVYKDIDDRTTTTGDDLTTVVSATTGITGITGGVSDFSGREKRRQKREKREREKERRREEKAREKEERKNKSRRKVDADGVIVDEDAEQEAQEHLRNYRHEKPARVGGINREADSSQWDGSTNPSWSTMSPSHAAPSSTGDTGSTVTDDLMGHRQRTPTSTPTKPAGIRKVYSTADKNTARENERIRAEARRLQEKGRAAAASKPPRRDFSFTHGAEETMALRRIEEAPIAEESVVSAPSSAYTENYPTTTPKKSSRPRSRSRHRRSAAPAAAAPIISPPSTVASGDSRGVPGSWVESEVGSASDVGTKVYRHSHHIPVAGSSVTGSSVTGTGSEMSYAEEKRKKRGGAGARRGRE